MEHLRRWFTNRISLNGQTSMKNCIQTSLLMRFFDADDELQLIASELDQFDGRKEPERCNALVNQLRIAQDKVISIIFELMDFWNCKRANRDYRIKFPGEPIDLDLCSHLTLIFDDAQQMICLPVRVPTHSTHKCTLPLRFLPQDRIYFTGSGSLMICVQWQNSWLPAWIRYGLTFVSLIMITQMKSKWFHTFLSLIWKTHRHTLCNTPSRPWLVYPPHMTNEQIIACLHLIK